MLSLTSVSHSTARLVCPIAMGLCVASLPICLYFASVSKNVGRHLALIFTSLALLSIFCYALRVLLAPLDSQGGTGGPRRRPILDPSRTSALGPQLADEEKQAGQGEKARSLESDRDVPPLSSGSPKPPLPQSSIAPTSDAHIQGEIGRW
ncbi:hypothetical protein DB88DRAFT_542548 [Papiliotrema laurentii]|uniref:Transmembrane protein n=1 Tax=Papiliotrema laurentii TaxID=5418 RepID=A0AAD9CVX8_PAPLA|nr:hypothetical protein DB88DRAFT_542548 [Papiliotrema laurentii]